ncbi:MAG: hypothetical protein Q7J82_01220 [Coriobacteriia bacterium]|nr:hypothetical protein [Coriobacteriia bacterium]
MRGKRFARTLALALIGALVLVTVTACGSTPEKEPYEELGGIPDDMELVNEAAQDVDLIPAGRAIPEGGGGPNSYTFREEWRRALPEAQKWRIGAYLISAVGDYVNNEGVPSEWRFSFISDRDPGELLFVYMDPWGKITRTEEKTDDEVMSNVSEYDKPMAYDVIDSDEAVTIATTLLGARYNLADTKDPRIALGWSEMDGSGPYWEYSLFDNATATYISAQIDARTGVVTLQE